MGSDDAPAAATMSAPGQGAAGATRTFRVWAPLPARVELAIGARRLPMEPEEGGWWAGRAEAPAGTDYGFVLDGEGPFPDPRSRCQPRGVHGPSRVLELAAFPWTDRAWAGLHLPSAVVYELHVGTFTPEGTFDAVIARLDHLVELGVSAVELMPVAAFPGRHGWGYDGVHLAAPHQPYGGPEGLQRLVDACHGRGLGVLLDVVYNHLGPDGNTLHRYGPYFTRRYATPWGEAPNLDGPGSDEVRALFIENALSWLRDYHLDGLRLDAVHAIVDTSAVHLLEELAERVQALEGELARPLWLVAESDLNDPRLLRSREAGGYGLHAQWSDDFHHALHAVLTGERQGYYGDFGRLADVAAALTRAFVYDGRYSPYRGRRHGRPIRALSGGLSGGLSGARFFGYLQNHDQVGNRARGERLSQLLPPGRLQVGAALVLTAPFVPLLFQGEEWGASTPFQYFTDHTDPQLAEATRQGRLSEFSRFGWAPEQVPDPQDPATFQRSRLDWTEPGREPHASLLRWYRTLIRLRRELPDLADLRLDRVQARADERAETLVVRRGRVWVACNLAPEPRRLSVPPGRIRLASDDGITLAPDPGPAAPDGPGAAQLTLPPDSVAVLEW